MAADSNKISSFGGGSAAVSIPYALAAGEDKNAVVVYYIDDSGNVESVRGRYNEAAGTVSFTVSHFSKYAVGYNKVSFSDVDADAWYADAVTFIAARGITRGTSEKGFSPDAAITRGQFIVMLMNAYGIAPDESENNFADAGDTYYTAYLARAKVLGIAERMGDNWFAPESGISRQDMFTLLYRALDKIGELPAAEMGGALSAFSDSADISEYANAAFKTLVRSGIVTGNNGRLHPKTQATRSQMAQLLYNLLSV